MKLEKFVWTGIAALVALCIGTAPISAKPGTAKPGAAKITAAKPSTPKPATIKTTTVKSQAMKPTTSGPKVKATTAPKVKTTTAPKVKTTTTPKVKTTTGAPVKSTKSAKAGKVTTTTTTTTTTTANTTTTGTTTGGTTETPVTLSKAQQKLTSNAKLATKMEQRMGTALPANVTVIQAASGFKNLGQFVAAVNVSYNHEGISFTELKKLMVKEGYSLGQAMQKLKATDATTTAQRAEYDANRMIETSEREIASPTGVTATPVPTTSTSSATSSTTTTTASKAKPKKSKKTAGVQQ